VVSFYVRKVTAGDVAHGRALLNIPETLGWIHSTTEEKKMWEAPTPQIF
jgi:hypothetical protein